MSNNEQSVINDPVAKWLKEVGGVKLEDYIKAMKAVW